MDWVKSYLTGRVQTVVIENSTLTCRGLECGVPRGSVLGPKMYCMYTRPVGDIVRKHGLLYHGYADDAPPYLIIKSGHKWHSVKAVCEACVAGIGLWMDGNMLKLNQEKTELTAFSSRYKSASEDMTLTVGDSVVSVAPCVRIFILT